MVAVDNYQNQGEPSILVFRHCERSEAIQRPVCDVPPLKLSRMKVLKSTAMQEVINGIMQPHPRLLRYARNDTSKNIQDETLENHSKGLALAPSPTTDYVLRTTTVAHFPQGVYNTGR